MTLVGVGAGVGVGVGVGWVEMGGVRVVWWGVSNELVDEELLVCGLQSETVELSIEVFCELFVQESQKRCLPWQVLRGIT